MDEGNKVIRYGQLEENKTWNVNLRVTNTCTEGGIQFL